MEQITERQHFVPQFYLKQWGDAKGQITCHDLSEGKTFSCKPLKVLAQNFFYEEDPARPDNRIEKVLSGIEGKASRTFETLSAYSGDVSQLHAAFAGEELDTLYTFAAYQYMRVPGAIDQKAYELQHKIGPADRADALNPGRFVESGYAYVREHFEKLKMLILVSPGTPYVTSDWPCFDMKDSEYAPLLGEEIGRESRVVCCLPLSPRLAAILYPPTFTKVARFTPRLVVKLTSDGEVKNMNTLVIQRAERFVVSSKSESFVFAVASKRKARPSPSQKVSPARN